MPSSPDENEAEIASLQGLDDGGDWDGIFDTVFTEDESNGKTLVDNSVLMGVDVGQKGPQLAEGLSWYIEEALPLGHCFGMQEGNDEGIRTLLIDLNLNFRKNGNLVKKGNFQGGNANGRECDSQC